MPVAQSSAVEINSNRKLTAVKISALVPVYSETDLLIETLARLKASLGELLHEFLIIVSPKSSPECLDLCQRLPSEDPLVKTFIQSDKPGIGWAYRELIPHVTGTHALIISSDLETNPDDAARLAEAAERTGADIVCASRWHQEGGFTGYDPVKLVLNYGYNLIFRTLYGISIHDITFGYRLMKTDVLRKIRWEYGRHEFCAELLLKPVRLGFTAVEVPTKWIKRPEGESKNTFARNFKFAHAAWRIRFRSPKQFRADQWLRTASDGDHLSKQEAFTTQAQSLSALQTALGARNQPEIGRGDTSPDGSHLEKVGKSQSEASAPEKQAS